MSANNIDLLLDNIFASGYSFGTFGSYINRTIKDFEREGTVLYKSDFNLIFFLSKEDLIKFFNMLVKNTYTHSEYLRLIFIKESIDDSVITERYQVFLSNSKVTTLYSINIEKKLNILYDKSFLSRKITNNTLFILKMTEGKTTRSSLFMELETKKVSTSKKKHYDIIDIYKNIPPSEDVKKIYVNNWGNRHFDVYNTIEEIRTKNLIPSISIDEKIFIIKDKMQMYNFTQLSTCKYIRKDYICCTVEYYELTIGDELYYFIIFPNMIRCYKSDDILITKIMYYVYAKIVLDNLTDSVYENIKNNLYAIKEITAGVDSIYL
jgi:hypothetical protein